MKRIRKSRAARLLSWLLTVVMITPVVLGVLSPRTADAQTLTGGAASLQLIIVNDFANKAGIGGTPLSRYATDAVSEELSNSGRFEVITRQVILNKAKDLGYVPPFDNTTLLKLATELGASSIVTGELSFVKVEGKRAPKRVTVGMKVFVRDSNSNDLTNGAAQVGISESRPGQTDDMALANESVGKAAILSVKQILAYNIPEGIVMSSVGSGNSVQIIINRGSRDGIQEGMQMVVLRNRQKVGRIGITHVFPGDSEAKVLDNTLGIGPEDHIRAIFPEPIFNAVGGQVVNVGSRSSGSAMRSVGQILLVVLLGGILVAMLQGGKNSTVTGVVAEAFTQVNSDPSVRILWRDNLFGSNAMEYHIWRNPDASFNVRGVPAGALGSSAGSREFDDVPSPKSFWDGVRSFRRQVDDTTAGGVSTIVTPAINAVTGFKLGNSYTYQVSSIFRQTSVGSSGGTTTVNTDIESNPVSSGQATPLSQPVPSSPIDQSASINLQSVRFVWGSVVGADEYIVEVSLTPFGAASPSSIAQLPINASSSVGGAGVPQQYPSNIDLTTNAQLLKSTVFWNFVNKVVGSATPIIYWRVGARNSLDNPGPMSWFTKDPHDGSKMFRWIYSPQRSFSPAPTPPAF